MVLIRRLWAEQRAVFIAFLLALVLALFFGGRIVVRTLYWANPAHQHQSPEAWMTPGYIARSWHLPVEAVDAVIGIENGPELVGKGPPTLQRIAEVLDVPLADLIGRLETTLPEIAQPRAQPRAQP